MVYVARTGPRSQVPRHIRAAAACLSSGRVLCNPKAPGAEIGAETGAETGVETGVETGADGQ